MLKEFGRLKHFYKSLLFGTASVFRAFWLSGPFFSYQVRIFEFALNVQYTLANPNRGVPIQRNMHIIRLFDCCSTPKGLVVLCKYRRSKHLRLLCRWATRTKPYVLIGSTLFEVVREYPKKQESLSSIVEILADHAGSY